MSHQRAYKMIRNYQAKFARLKDHCSREFANPRKVEFWGTY